MTQYKCCGLKLFIEPRELGCTLSEINNRYCIIKKGETYFQYKDSSDSEEYIVCKTCFDQSGSNIPLPTDSVKIVSKFNFFRATNNIKLLEPSVECAQCNDLFHAACVLHIATNENPYYCQNCAKKKNHKNNLKRLLACDLPETDLSNFIQTQVNCMLEKEGCPVQSFVTIRIVAEHQFQLTLKPSVSQNLIGEGINSLPYRGKAIYAFQNDKNRGDLLFFALYVQEFDDKCPQPNTRRVYIAYLDSVNLFQPKYLRTSVYQEILINYLSNVRQRGFVYAHIWSCPPNSGEDYIFYRHPANQKTPKKNRLISWYRRILNEATNRREIIGYSDLYTHFVAYNINRVDQVPLFDGDFWMPMLEDMVSGNTTDVGVQEVAKRFGDEFLAIQLNEEDRVSEMSWESRCILRSTEFVGRRDGLLMFCRDELMEWSTERRARLATLKLLDELWRINAAEQFSCDACGVQQLQEWWSCATCLEYDLCSVCRRIKNEHQHHTMQYIRHINSLSYSTPSIDADTTAANKSSNVSMTQALEILKHSLNCRRSCARAACASMKGLLLHATNCQLPEESCHPCHAYTAIIIAHVHQCSQKNCVLPFCREYRAKQQRKAARQAWERAFREQMRYQHARKDEQLFRKMFEIRGITNDSSERRFLLEQFLVDNPEYREQFRLLEAQHNNNSNSSKKHYKLDNCSNNNAPIPRYIPSKIAEDGCIDLGQRKNDLTKCEVENNDQESINGTVGIQSTAAYEIMGSQYNLGNTRNVEDTGSLGQYSMTSSNIINFENMNGGVIGQENALVKQESSANLEYNQLNLNNTNCDKLGRPRIIQLSGNNIRKEIRESDQCKSNDYNELGQSRHKENNYVNLGKNTKSGFQTQEIITADYHRQHQQLNLGIGQNYSSFIQIKHKIEPNDARQQYKPVLKVDQPIKSSNNIYYLNGNTNSQIRYQVNHTNTVDLGQSRTITKGNSDMSNNIVQVRCPSNVNIANSRKLYNSLFTTSTSPIATTTSLTTTNNQEFDCSPNIGRPELSPYQSYPNQKTINKRSEIKYSIPVTTKFVKNSIGDKNSSTAGLLNYQGLLQNRPRKKVVIKNAVINLRQPSDIK